MQKILDIMNNHGIFTELKEDMMAEALDSYLSAMKEVIIELTDKLKKTTQTKR